MERVTKYHILSVLACTLRICIETEPMIRTICQNMQRSNLKLLSKEVLIKKLNSILLHANVKTLSNLFKRGLLNNSYILSMVVRVVRRRNLQQNPEVQEIISHYGT